MKKTKVGFIANGREQGLEAVKEKIKMRVRKKYSKQLSEAEFFKKVLLEFQIKKEINSEIEKIAPKDGLYLKK